MPISEGAAMVIVSLEAADPVGPDLRRVSDSKGENVGCGGWVGAAAVLLRDGSRAGVDRGGAMVPADVEGRAAVDRGGAMVPADVEGRAAADDARDGIAFPPGS